MLYEVITIQSLREKSIKKRNFFFGCICADPEEFDALPAAILVDRWPCQQVPIRSGMQRLKKLAFAECNQAQDLIRLHDARAKVLVVFSDGAERRETHPVETEYGFGIVV